MSFGYCRCGNDVSPFNSNLDDGQRVGHRVTVCALDVHFPVEDVVASYESLVHHRLGRSGVNENIWAVDTINDSAPSGPVVTRVGVLCSVVL